MVAIDLHSVGKILWKSMGAVKCLVTSILQNIIFCCREFIVRENLDLYQVKVVDN